MSANELNSFLNSFHRPINYSNTAWEQLLHQSRLVWDKYLSGEDWQQQLEITCKEAYLMLVNSEGKLIISNESLLTYVKNEHTSAWRQKLEGIAHKAFRAGRFGIAERYFGKLIKLDADNAMHFYKRSLARIKEHNLRGALADLSEAIKLQPEIAKFYLKRAEVFRLLDIDHKAMADFNTAIKIQPNNALAFSKRGSFRLALGDKAGGRLDLLRSDEILKDSSGYYGEAA